MSDEAPDATVAKLAKMIVKEMRDDPQLASMVREAILSVYATTDQLSREGYVRSLLRTCKERGASLHVNPKGALIVTNGMKLSPQIRDALKVYRQDVIEVLSPHKNGKITK